LISSSSSLLSSLVLPAVRYPGRQTEGGPPLLSHPTPHPTNRHCSHTHLNHALSIDSHSYSLIHTHTRSLSLSSSLLRPFALLSSSSGGLARASDAAYTPKNTRHTTRIQAGTYRAATPSYVQCLLRKHPSSHSHSSSPSSSCSPRPPQPQSTGTSQNEEPSSPGRLMPALAPTLTLSLTPRERT